MGINLQFDEDKRAGIQQAWSQWWTGELERPIVLMRGRSRRLPWDPTQLTKEFFLETSVDKILDHYQPRLENVRYYGDSLPTFGPYFGSGIATAFLGGNVEPRPEERTVWFQANEPTPFEDLHFTYDPDNVWWRRVVEITERAVERWGDRITICYAVLGGIIDLLGTFRRTQQLLYDLYEAPEEVIRLTKDITDVWVRYYEELTDIISEAGLGTTNYANLWSPGRTYMHESDFIYMISAEMFERFVLPNLDRCFRQMDHAFYHLDGKGAIRHLDMLLSLESLRGIQWVPGEGQPQASEWMSLLGRIRAAGKLCQVYVNPDGAREIVRELGGRGFCFVVSSPALLSPEEADGFLSVLAAEDANAV